MNIIFLSRLFYPHIGGVEKHVMEVGKRLVKKGYKVTVLTEELLPTNILVYQYSASSAKRSEKVEGIDIYRMLVGKNDWFKKFRIWKELWYKRNLINNADIIHAHDVFFWCLPFRFLYPSKKIFTTFHGYEGNKIPGFKAKFMHKVAEKLSVGNICVGDFLKKWYGTKPDYVTYGAVEVSSIKYQVLSINKNKLKFLFLGRLEEETGIMEYFKALKILKEKRYKFAITICGDGCLRKKAQDFCNKHKITAIFKGFVEDVNRELSSCDFVFVSRYLGILEALSFKKFIFAVYNNKIKKDYLEIAPFAKYISISKDYKELSNEIEYYLKNDQKRNEMIDQGFNWVKNETWEKMVNLYIDLWSQK